MGESACTGFHGANRLASNSLLEGLVCGHNCGLYLGEIMDSLGSNNLTIPDWHEGSISDSKERVVISQNWEEIRKVMQNYAGIVKTDKWLKRAWDRLTLINEEIFQYYWDFKITSDLIELRNLCSIARLILKCAHARKESRGIHYSLDYPEKANLARDSIVQKHW